MRVLVLYHAGFTYTAAIAHYLHAFRDHSRHRVDFFNIDQPYDESLDFSRYDLLFVNFCVVSFFRLDESQSKTIDPTFREQFPALLTALTRFSGPKVIGIQDEYDFTNRVNETFQRIGVDVILTNVPPEGVGQIYPGFTNTRFETVQTAYLSDELLAQPHKLRPLAERSIPLGYRGRLLSYRLGDLGWHKSEVGRRFKALCLVRDVPCDIEVEEHKRFGGIAWLEFIRSCRVMLGSPSGSNVFDFDGGLHRAILALWKEMPAISYQEVRDEICQHEVDFDMGQISARIYEAVTSRTALALVRGSYSGVVEPDEHYVPIEPDYSNVDQVLTRILDVNAMQEMADRTYDHVVNNPRNHYFGLVARLDNLFEEVSRETSSTWSDDLPYQVTSSPLGTDPYLFVKLIQLRQVLEKEIDRTMAHLKLAAAGQLEVIAHPDGTYRILKKDHVDVR